MKISEKKLDDSSVKLSALASPAEVSHALFVAQYQFVQSMGLKVENGKKPAEVAQEKLGIKDLDGVVAIQAAEYLVPIAIDKSNIMPAFIPQGTFPTKIQRGQTFSFDVIVTPRPEYELSSYEPVSIEVEPFDIPEAEIDEQIKLMAQQYTVYNTVDPRPIEKDDCCLISLEASKDGKVIDQLSTKSRTYILGKGYLPEKFDDKLLGMQPGDTKTFDLDVPSAAEDKETETITCVVTVNEIQELQLPDIDDDWVAENIPMLGNVETLRASLAESLAFQQRGQYEAYKLQLAAKELEKRFDGEISDRVYEASHRNLIARLRDQLQSQGIPFEQWVESQGGDQQVAMMTMMQTREMLVQGFVLDAYFRHNKLVLTDEDIDAAAQSMNPQNPKALRRDMEQNGRGFALREAAERMKANKVLLERAEVKIIGQEQGE